MTFTENDKTLLSDALDCIEQKQRLALILRFWEYHEIDEIAHALNVTWADADRLIENGKEEIKKLLLQNPLFLWPKQEELHEAA